jgi:hypothetical protein
MTPPRARALRRIERAIFCGFLATYAYFHQGGGWNQNGRFAQARAIAEEGRLAIDSYLVYEPSAGPGDPAFVRAEVRGGAFLRDGVPYHLGWPDAEGRMVAAGEPAAPGVVIVPLVQVAATGDVSYGRGSFYPNKAPGTALLAAPGYAVVVRLERLLGLDPDAWRTLTVNAWLASALSVGLVAALGCVVFFRAALALSKGSVRSSLFATLAFGAGTLHFPYATMLFEHDLVAVALLTSFYLLLRVRDGAPSRAGLAGLAAGAAVSASYVAAAVVPVLVAYLAARRREARAIAWFAAGAAVPCLLLAVYHAACFGSPLSTPYAFENPAFHSTGARLLSIFGAPDPAVGFALLFSPFRGLFFSSPVLLMGACFLGAMLRRREHRAEALACAAVAAVFLVVNASFNGWHGGAALGPRYLVPAIPFLALPLVFAFGRMRAAAAVLAALSAVLMLLGTAVDPQCPLGVLPIAPVEGPLWRADPWTEYEVPLLATGRATPASDGSVLASLEGPVSVNPIGVYEGWFYLAFPPGSPEARGNSFNFGEGLFPRSPMSLLPLLAVWTAVLAAALGAARDANRAQQRQ